jgi:hypothetical protein
MSFWGFLEIVDKIVALVLLVGGVAGFAFKAWIAEWIKNKFARAVGQELESYKHQLNRDLESYKGSLLRELEQFRANIDIRRTVAIKRADAKLEALRNLTSSADRFVNEVVSMCNMDKELRNHNLSEWNNSAASVRTALRSAEIFLPSELVRDIANMNSAGANLVGECRKSETILDLDDERLNDILKKWSGIYKRLKEEIHADPQALQ